MPLGKSGVMDKKVILVTGASSGIGLAGADWLSQHGWAVIGASRRGTSGDAWTGLAMDVDDDESVNEGVARTVAEHARIDAVWANAGWGLAGSAEQTSIVDARAQMETNFWGAVRVVQAVLPVMRGQGGGRIVLTSSIGGLIGIPFQAFYSASKFALEGYGEALAYEVEPFNIHVTLIEPGNFKTGFTKGRRMVATAPDDPYAGARERAIELMERDEMHGAAPVDVAKVVERVLAARRPPRRASAGKFDERIGLVAKRLIPFRLFEKAARKSLGV
jgi:NAD(P)-dependent dehydrogenase (short-subunit alcohol dehydrogenase family)